MTLCTGQIAVEPEETEVNLKLEHRLSQCQYHTKVKDKTIDEYLMLSHGELTPISPPQHCSPNVTFRKEVNSTDLAGANTCWYSWVNHYGRWNGMKPRLSEDTIKRGSHPYSEAIIQTSTAENLEREGISKSRSVPFCVLS